MVKNCLRGNSSRVSYEYNILLQLGETDVEKFKDLANCLLVASTAEAYDNAFGHINSFIRSLSANADKLKNWLDWWHNRRHNIFRAFTGYQYPRSNLAEVIHASYEQRDQKGLSLLESAEFDTRYSLLLESELTQFPLLDEPAPGRGQNLISLKKRFFERQREVAAQKRSEFISFSIELSSHGKQKNE